jgi:hypothetical protein
MTPTLLQYYESGFKSWRESQGGQETRVNDSKVKDQLELNGKFDLGV